METRITRSAIRHASAIVVAAAGLTSMHAQAVTPDNRAPISIFWDLNFAPEAHWNWASAVGWSSQGMFWTYVTASSGESGGLFTGRVFATICGTTAAATVARWRPPYHNNPKAFLQAAIKAAATPFASGFCNWAAPAIQNAIDAGREVTRRVFLTPGVYADLSRSVAIKSELQDSLEARSQAEDQFRRLNDQYNKAACYLPNRSTYCQMIASARGGYRIRAYNEELRENRLVAEDKVIIARLDAFFNKKST